MPWAVMAFNNLVMSYVTMAPCTGIYWGRTRSAKPPWKTS